MKKIVALIAGSAMVLIFSMTAFSQMGLPGGTDLINSQLSKLEIKFAHNSYKLDTPEYIQMMDSASSTIKSISSQVPATHQIFVVGHASSDGGKEINQGISTARARTVFYRLKKAGVDKKIMEYIGVSDTAGSKKAVTFELRKSIR